MSSPIPTLRAYGDYLESLDTPLDIDALLVAEGDAEHLTLEEEGPVIDLVDDEPRKTRGRGGPEQPSGRPSRRGIAVGVAAAVALIVGTGVLVDIATDGGTDNGVEVVPPAGPGPVATTAPPAARALPDGLVGLPPEGATPSTPETGQLLAPLTIPVWVYEDGRVIFAHWRTHEDWTGFLERRLTPEGVELVWAEIRANEPFGECRATMGFYGYTDAARMVCERPGQPFAADSENRRYPRLMELPYGAPSWLPASAWADPEPKPYVPSTYEVQIGGSNDEAGEQPPLDASALFLPPEAVELLTVPAQCAGSVFGPNTLCFTVRTEEARQIAAALGIPPPSENENSWEVAMEGHFGSYAVRVVPYLPHESPVWCCGG